MDSLVLLFRLSREKTPFTQSLLIFIVNILQSNANCFNDKGGKCTFFSGYSGLNLLNNVIWKTDCLVCSGRCPGNSKFTHETTSVLQLIKLIVLHLPCFICIATVLLSVPRPGRWNTVKASKTTLIS